MRPSSRLLERRTRLGWVASLRSKIVEFRGRTQWQGQASMLTLPRQRRRLTRLVPKVTDKLALIQQLIRDLTLREIITQT